MPSPTLRARAAYNGPPPDSRWATDTAACLGVAIRDARLDAGLTQEALAGLTGTTQSMISYLERGRYPGVGLRVLGRVADVLALDLQLVSR